MRSENECYGKMFPSVVSMAHNQAICGEVFGYRLDYQGAVLQKREAIVNRVAWDKCLQCRDMESCYRFSTGKLLVELAVRTIPETLY